MKKLILLIHLFLYAIGVSAQTISGIVVDMENIPVSFATVVLCSLPDTTQINYAITDLEGRFEFERKVEEGLLLQISFVGYKTSYVPVVINQRIILEENSVSISEVVIKGKRPISRITTNGVETPVANTILSEMGSGNEVLKRIPMVTGDDGNFEVFGKGKARIYINNREVRDASELDNLSAKEIQNIEVITNPGARYDATVPAVINITTKKQQGDGISFNIRSSFYTWKNQDYVNQINSNYRNGGLDIFANIYYSDITSTQKGNIAQIAHIDTLWRQVNVIDGVFLTNNLNGSFGTSYEINSNHNIGFRYDLNSSPKYETDNINLGSDIYTNGVLYDRWKNNELKEIRNNPASQVNLYYAGKIDKLSVDFNNDFMNVRKTTHNVNTEISEELGNRIIHSMNYLKNTLWASKLQLSYSLGKGEIMAGVEFVNISRTDEYQNDDLLDFSSRVGVKEQNIALFSAYRLNTQIGNLSVGIRYEDASYDYLTDGIKAIDKSRHYRQWFPDVSFSTLLGEFSLQLNYNSKVIRPSYSQLSNNLLYANRLTIQTGNPYLKPTMKQDVSITTVWKICQLFVSYTHQKDAIVTWIDRYDRDPKVSVVTHNNLKKLSTLTAFFAVAPTFGVWKPQLNGGVTKQSLDLLVGTEDLKMNKPLFFAAFNNVLELPLDFMINMDAEYSGKGHHTTIYVYDDSFIVNIGVTKNFFNKSLQAKIAVSDVFNQNINAYQVLMPQTELKNHYHFDKREISLTLRYYFNTAINKYKGSQAGKEAMDRF